ncbi:MAG: hypothetical protein M1828_002202 [Chrysothrix sp. TS-e1954]|nr:MAG: hypothetical protein M1828_002202 [Chrysothrix sp. TS-e1954]
MTSKDASTKPSHRKSTRGEYIETDTGNKVSRRALITGTAHITLAGRVVVSPHAILRGDLVSPAASSSSSSSGAASSSGPRTSIAVSRYTYIGAHATLHPPHRLVRPSPSTSSTTQQPPLSTQQTTLHHLTLRIGENVHISPHAHIAAASIGSNVFIGERAVIGNLCVLRDGCKVLPDAVLAEGMVVPSGVVVGGRPARFVGDVADAWGVGGGGGKGVWCEGGELRELVRGVR